MPTAMNLASTLPPEILANVLYVFLGRLQCYFTLVEQSLRGEYVYEEQIVDEWSKTLLWLENAFFPVHQLLRLVDNEPLSREYLPSLQRRLVQSRILLRKKELPPAERLYGLLRNLREIRAGLVVWRRALVSEYDLKPQENSPGSKYAAEPISPSLIEALQQTIRETPAELERGDEVPICMRLRAAFFYLYYTAVVRPAEWSNELYEQVLNLHRQALVVVPPGMAQDSIRRRLEKLEHFTHSNFERFAAAPV